jgi:hypothetical protein
MTELALGNWPRTAAVAVVLMAAFIVVLVAASGIGPLRYASFPGHPYPPAGYVQDPFSTNPDDMLSTADVARVRSDFERDGSVELDAFATGNAGVLSQADAGGRLQTLRQLVAQNSAAGIVQRYENHVRSIVVGRRATPAGTSITWSVDEQGTAALADVEKATGTVLRTRSYRFDSRFWLAMGGGRYLITDAAISNEPSTGG